MKVVINVGKVDKQFSNYSSEKPKSLIEIGDMPILWHIMKFYSSYGYKDFVLLCCEKAYSVKEFFYNYSIHHGNVEINLKNQTIKSLNSDIEDWNISVIDVGKNSYSGGALKKAREVIGNEPFMYTYGDGLSNIDLDLLLSHHVRHKKMITISSITASQKFGVIDFNDNGSVVGFREKDNLDSVVNGGFMVFNPEVFDLIDDDPKTVFEKEPMVTAVACHQVTAYRHKGFWRSLDSYEDLEELNEMWENNRAPWKLW